MTALQYDWLTVHVIETTATVVPYRDTRDGRMAQFIVTSRNYQMQCRLETMRVLAGIAEARAILTRSLRRKS